MCAYYAPVLLWLREIYSFGWSDSSATQCPGVDGDQSPFATTDTNVFRAPAACSAKIRFQSAYFPVSARYLRRDALTPAHEMIRGVGGNGAAIQ